MPNSVAGIIKRDGKYLLGKRKPGGSIGGKWEFPGGKVENGESFELSLKREFREELDIDITVKEFITRKKFSSGDHTFSLYAYYVDMSCDDIKNREHDEFKWFTLNEITHLGIEFADSDKLLLDSL